MLETNTNYTHFLSILHHRICLVLLGHTTKFISFKAIVDIWNTFIITTESSWKDSNQIILTRHFPPATNKIFTQDSEMFEVCINDNGEMEKIEQ